MTRANEHTRSSGVLGKHFKDCVVNTGKDIEMTILHRSNRGLMFLSILEALHIREHKPQLNKKMNTFIDRYVLEYDSTSTVVPYTTIMDLGYWLLLWL